jgi:hypothetical protein
MVIDSYEKSSTSQPLYCISLLTNNFDEDKRPEFTLTSESDRSIFPNTLRMRRLTMQITLAFPAVTNGCLFSLPFHNMPADLWVRLTRVYGYRPQAGTSV